MKGVKMKNSLIVILKPIVIFSLYITTVALLSNIIVSDFNFNITAVYTAILILTYPIYYYLTK